MGFWLGLRIRVRIWIGVTVLARCVKGFGDSWEWDLIFAEGFGFGDWV